MKEATKRNGTQTRAAAQRVALALFTTKGFAATSLREIAEQLGISKAALYYHFPSKEEIVRSLVSTREDEAKELLRWVRAQKPGPQLLERAVMRWIESTSEDKLHGIRFVNANPAILRSLGKNPGRGIRDALGAVAKLVAGPHANSTRQLLVRMAFLSINSAVMAARGTKRTDKEIVAAAKELALSIIDRLRDS